MPDCVKCKKQIPDGALYCPWCGKKQSATKKAARKRGNGQGAAYKRGNYWEARVVIGWKIGGEPPHKIPVYKTKGGFATKKEAVNYLPELLKVKIIEHKPESFTADKDHWKEQYQKRVSAKTMEGYLGAFKYFAPIHYKLVDTITAVDLQKCIDDCPKGKRTKQLMKVVAGLVFKYAMDANQIMKDPSENLYLGDEETTHYEPLTEEELRTIEQSGLDYSDYVVAMCYLGHRPTEFWAFKKKDYHKEGDTHYLVGGIKTDAGKDRAVTIPPKVLPIIQHRLSVVGTDLLFPRIDHNRKGEFTGYSQMPERYFNKYIWKPMMEKLGIVGKVPYAARHTYANKMKNVSGDEKDKAGLMGHASYETTRKHYQTTTLAEKKAITDQIK